ncbi:MAG TPA: hypothetical protein VJB14_11740, partial [Planctomycetota bacterium]|nr:hypothetical protein [Planctomycetota bacterium]
LVKRGMIVLAADWFGFGQLRGPGYEHDRLNQLDLCGTSGLAPFYLTLKRGLDVLLSLDHADPDRAAVHGLSGGGWQTIWISALDPRVTLCNPVAGYSTLRTMTRHLKDLPDSEQAPSDLATVTDYAWFAALRAPRPTLLTYNRKDDCCYESGYALAPLVDAAQPIYRLFGKESNLRSHVHADPGNHNYGEDNRLALYRFVGDHFFPGDGAFDAKEIACDAEIKSVAELTVDLPKDNATFNSLARGLAADLPRKGGAGRAQLRAILRAKDDKVRTAGARTETGGGMKGVLRSFAMEGGITVPGVELSPAKPRSTTLLFSESGRKGLADEVARRLAAGERVLAVDPLGFGESKIAKHDVDFSLMLSAVGDRPLGIQASQLGAIARWAASEYKESSVTLAAIGPRASLAALAAAALEERAVGRVELSGCLKSLKDVLEQNLSYEKAPELFCFGLLEAFDVQPLMDLVAPRPVETLK